MSRHVIVTIVAALFVVLATPLAWGADMEGKVQSVDESERTLTLDNGTKIWLSDSVAVDGVKEGMDVKVSYEEKDGKPLATSVETK
jgi:hypothetical protein